MSHNHLINVLNFGVAHARMRFRVIAEEETDFNTWMEA